MALLMVPPLASSPGILTAGSSGRDEEEEVWSLECCRSPLSDLTTIESYSSAPRCFRVSARALRDLNNEALNAAFQYLLGTIYWGVGRNV